MVELLTLLFTLQLSLFILVDYLKFDTIYTPVLFLGGPFLFVLVIAVFFSERMGFLPVETMAIVLWSVSLLVFWASGTLFSFALSGNAVIIQPFAHFVQAEIFTDIVRYASFIFLTILTVKLLILYSKFGSIGSDAFSEEFASHGIAAHCLSMMKFNAAYLAGTFNRQRCQKTVIILLTVFFLFVYNVKGGIFLTVLVCFFTGSIMSKRKLSFLKILSLLLMGAGIFTLSYIISLRAVDINFIIYHFYTYIVAGVTGLSQHLAKGLPTDTDFMLVVQPVKNIINILSGEPALSRVNELWVTISHEHARRSNVKTFFGDILIYAGWLKGLLVIIICGIFSYAIMIFAMLKKSLVCLVLYLFIIASLMLGWFNYYLNDLFYYEVIIYIFIISVFAKMRHYLFGPSCYHEVR